jgi:uncharacterized protein YndB with AHSA1/START domain
MKLTVTTEVPNEIHMTRTFDAPRALVKEAMTTPALLMRWLGNRFSPIISAEVDARVGGRYRYAFRRTDGVEFAFSGIYDELDDDHAVQTETFEGMPGSAKVTTRWIEKDGKTTLDIVIRHASQEIRDMVIKTGMEKGAAESYDNLEALLAR